MEEDWAVLVAGVKGLGVGVGVGGEGMAGALVIVAAWVVGAGWVVVGGGEVGVVMEVMGWLEGVWVGLAVVEYQVVG